MAMTRGDKLNAPQLGDAIPQRRNRLLQRGGRFLLALAGWRFEGVLPNVSKLVIIAAPHTSNWDFVLGMTVLFALGIRVYWLGKHTFVNSPPKALWRWMGGIPVDRRAAQGMVEQVAAQFAARQQFILAIAPEGTRRKVSQWKLGFYYIARRAQVSIMPVSLDYGRKVIGLGKLIEPVADKTAVLSQIIAFYKDVKGKIPESTSLPTL
jgi:1-acyl-sn-glycerol-3-phosphate acyltransferase